jgi:cellulose synthase/poly-beta-1,6-N-acetylglucosamine synthase-like glycosyltransferase
VIIDDASTDTTVSLVQNYIRQHPDFSRRIQLIRLYENVGKASALNRALESGLRGEFVMTLDADSVLDLRAIENATDYLIGDPMIAGVAANVRVVDKLSVLGLLQKFEYMVGYRSKKFYSVSNSEYIVGGVGSTYRYSVLKEVGFYDHDIQTEDIALSLKIAALLGNRTHKLVYGADVLAYTEGVQTLKALMRQRYRWKLGSLQALFKYRQIVMSEDEKYTPMLTWFRLPLAFIGEVIVLVEPVILGYIVYWSIMALSLQSFVGAYIFITVYLLWSVWPDEHMAFSDKLKMTAYTPIMYFLFYVMNVVQLSAAFRCLFNIPKVLRRRPTDSVWVSPERSGLVSNLSLGA